MADEQLDPRYVVEPADDGQGWLIIDRGDDRHDHETLETYDDEQLAHIEANALSAGDEVLDQIQSSETEPDSWWANVERLVADRSTRPSPARTVRDIDGPDPATSVERSRTRRLDRLLLDAFRASLAGEAPPAGFDHWGYTVVRVDYTSGGTLVWPHQDGTMAEPGRHTDGYRGGQTKPGVLAIAPDWHDAATTTDVGGSVLLTLAYRDADIVSTSAPTGLVFVRHALVVDADTGGLHLSTLAGRDIRDRTNVRRDWLPAGDVEALWAIERVTFLGPAPLQRPGKDTRVRTRLPVADGNWLGHAVARYRQPGYDATDVANALASMSVAPANDRSAAATVRAAGLRAGLSWQRQVAIQRRLDGYLLEQFGRVDPRVEDPGRPMTVPEQWLHLWPFGVDFLNMIETVIELDLLVDDLLGGDAMAIIQNQLRDQPEHDPSRIPGPVLRPGPICRLVPGSSDGQTD